MVLKFLGTRTGRGRVILGRPTEAWFRLEKSERKMAYVLLLLTIIKSRAPQDVDEWIFEVLGPLIRREHPSFRPRPSWFVSNQETLCHFNL